MVRRTRKNKNKRGKKKIRERKRKQDNAEDVREKKDANMMNKK